MDQLNTPRPKTNFPDKSNPISHCVNVACLPKVNNKNDEECRGGGKEMAQPFGLPFTSYGRYKLWNKVKARTARKHSLKDTKVPATRLHRVNLIAELCELATENTCQVLKNLFLLENNRKATALGSKNIWCVKGGIKLMTRGVEHFQQVMYRRVKTPQDPTTPTAIPRRVAIPWVIYWNTYPSSVCFFFFILLWRAIRRETQTATAVRCKVVTFAADVMERQDS
jgi:hypothetical protein